MGATESAPVSGALEIFNRIVVATVLAIMALLWFAAPFIGFVPAFVVTVFATVLLIAGAFVESWLQSRNW